MELEFFLPMKSPPTTTFQDKEINWKTRSFYKSDKVRKIEHQYKMLLADHVPDKKLIGPIRMVSKWMYPHPKSEEGSETRWKDTKPDTDNIVKILKDVMTELGFWKDDGQVASEIVEKFYSEPTGIYISVSKLEDI